MNGEVVLRADPHPTYFSSRSPPLEGSDPGVVCDDGFWLHDDIASLRGVVFPFVFSPSHPSIPSRSLIMKVPILGYVSGR